MFIDPSHQPHQLRSEERNSTRPSPLQSQSAPPNGAGKGSCSQSVNMSPLRGVKTVRYEREAWLQAFNLKASYEVPPRRWRRGQSGLSEFAVHFASADRVAYL